MTSIATSVLVTRPQRYSTNSGRIAGRQLFRVPGWDQSPGVGNAVRAALPTIRREEGTPARAHDEVLSRAEPHPNIDTCP